MISLTDNALTEVKRIFSEQELGTDTYLRLGVSGGGCSGFSYVMTFDKEVTAEDQQAEYDGVKVLMASSAEPYIGNVVVDFCDDLTKRGFVFNNPDAADNCGCGSSFSV